MKILGVFSSTPNKSFEQEPTRPQPSATEVFNLRSACAKLGRELDDSMLHGNAIARDTVSNYNAEQNRCFVTLESRPVDLSLLSYRTDRYLYDGQTQEMLASTTYFVNMPGNGNSGIVFAGEKDGMMGYTEVKAYIDGVMQRK